MKLYNAIEAYRKGINKRNLKLFTERVDKTITDEIRKRESLKNDLVRELEERKEEEAQTLTDAFLAVDDDRMVDVDKRKAYASEYVVQSVKALNSYEETIKGLDKEIEKLTKEIEILGTLASRFDNL